MTTSKFDNISPLGGEDEHILARLAADHLAELADGIYAEVAYDEPAKEIVSSIPPEIRPEEPLPDMPEQPQEMPSEQIQTADQPIATQVPAKHNKMATSATSRGKKNSTLCLVWQLAAVAAGITISILIYLLVM